MHDTDLVGVGLMSTRYWPFVGLWQYDSSGVANVPLATRQQTLRSLLNLSFTETSGHQPVHAEFQVIPPQLDMFIIPNVHIKDKSSLFKIVACHRIGKKQTITWTRNVSPGLNVLII